MVTTTDHHIAEVTPEGDGYLVTCPHGCKLGTSAHAPNEHAADVRVQLHKIATTPLTARPAYNPGKGLDNPGMRGLIMDT